MRYVAFLFMWCWAGSALILLNTEPAHGHIRDCLQRAQKGHQLRIFAPGFLGFRFTGDLAHRQGFGLHLQICFCVYIRGIKGDVAEPCANRVDIYASTE